MVEAGADEIPEDKLLEALELAHEEIKKLCEAQEELARQVGKPKWLDTSPDRGARGARTATGSASGSRPRACARRRPPSRRSSPSSAPELTMESTEEDIPRQVQVRQSLAMLLETIRLEAVEGPVRQQFENELRALTDAEQDSKELKSAKRNLLFDRIVETVELPFPVGPAAGGGRDRRSRTR